MQWVLASFLYFINNQFFVDKPVYAYLCSLRNNKKMRKQDLMDKKLELIQGKATVINEGILFLGLHKKWEMLKWRLDSNIELKSSNNTYLNSGLSWQCLVVLDYIKSEILIISDSRGNLARARTFFRSAVCFENSFSFSFLFKRNFGKIYTL